MEKVTKYLLVTFSILFFGFVYKTSSFAEYAENIKDFQTNIIVNKNGTIDVKETILYDFGTNERHGVYRNIDNIKTNEEGKEFLIGIILKNVINEFATPYTQTSSVGSSSYDIKIGDANKLISGLKTYVISYSVSGAITYYTDHDELYWNMTGDRWLYPIKSFSGKVTLPAEISSDQIKAECFDGPSGSTAKNCTVKIVGNTVLLTENKEINPSEGITLVMSFPKSHVAVLEPVPVGSSSSIKGPPKLFTLLFSLAFIFWTIILPIKILINAIKEKRELKQKAKIVAAWFEAPNFDNGTKFSPAETGFIYSKSASDKELTATIIDLAMRGYLKIKNDGKNKYSFERLEDFLNDTALKSFEKTVLKGIYGESGMGLLVKKEVSVSELGKNPSFTSAASNFKKEVEDSSMNASLFQTRPSIVAIKNGILGVLGIITVNIQLAIIAFFFGTKSARRTDKGIEKYSEAASLRNFLVSQDEQLDFQAKNQMFFEKLLPYATAFGVEDIWSKRFEGMQFHQADWYDGDFSSVVALTAFSHTLRSSVKTSSSFSTITSSSGFHSGFSGGHSGGGGGGGGGGSW